MRWIVLVALAACSTVARDVRISLDAERLAGAMFVGVSLGFAFRSEHEDLQ